MEEFCDEIIPGSLRRINMLLYIKHECSFQNSLEREKRPLLIAEKNGKRTKDQYWKLLKPELGHPSYYTLLKNIDSEASEKSTKRLQMNEAFIKNLKV